MLVQATVLGRRRRVLAEVAPVRAKLAPVAERVARDRVRAATAMGRGVEMPGKVRARRDTAEMVLATARAAGMVKVADRELAPAVALERVRSLESR